ncbi:adenosylmethionine-8-amino-7-oxononanoate aminotransferase [Thiosulfatimonas sediminis]|uniref:Adenosylmethionine-8-amino-7-oxononanoate aminotransferase n=1 Tax=Thiosulfatimonas sediminis TaxID=2675054 RepID=A0A6F8PXJ3_9GAMM|nr:adenosylmethionine--8-amino-7-oxononanoate transaminase [Thiosulfatimonas sediminis]BBP46872.1 adenosylmethionine-8-amino-7-oxononanoate aminotransferase [Thiosulfatimonas sediminis]
MQYSDHWQSLIDFDQQHIWHPYAPSPNPVPPIGVKSTQGSLITLADDRQVVDGMSSWWAAIHGYNHPKINAAMKAQIDTMPHIMFGGLTHEPAVELAKRLVKLTPEGLNKVFFADSGSVSMEVAIKIALQYWISQGKSQKNRMLSIRNGYHGDTFATMAVCDPVNGMHHLFNDVLRKNLFAPAPQMGFDIQSDNQDDFSDIRELQKILQQHHQEIAALTLEPIVQGAGGMRFYRPAYLQQAKALCEQYDVLLIADEIATGFGRTGKLFACEWAGITPDIMTVGKALTGGNLTMAAMLCTDKVSDTICQGEPGVLMHGPTFMANPLACATAIASIDLLLEIPWQENIATIEQHLKTELSPLAELDGVKDVRVMGAIGVVELERNDLGSQIQAACLENGAWIRPFGKLIYTMPAFNIPQRQLQTLTDAINQAVKHTLAKQ